MSSHGYPSSGSARINRGKSLLAVTYGGGHIAMIIPVLEQLRTLMPDLQVEVLALTTARARAQALDVRCTGYAELLAEWGLQEAVEPGRLLLPGNSHPEVEVAESVAYLGLNWLDLVLQHGPAEASRRYMAKGRASFHPLRLMLRLIADRAPDFVLTTNSPRSEQAAVEAAVELGIPCLSMFDIFPAPQDPYALRKVHADMTTVISAVARDTLVRSGMPASAIAVTGNPAFDALASPDMASEGQRLVRQLGWQNKWVVLYAGHAEPMGHGRWPEGIAFPLAIEQVLRRLVERRDDVAVVIRQHPSHWHLFKQSWARELRHPRIHVSLPGQERVEPWILASSAVVVQASTVGLQAAVVGRPVLSVDESPSCASSSFSWSAFGVARSVARIEDLEPELMRLRRFPPAAVLDIPSPAAPLIARMVASRLH